MKLLSNSLDQIGDEEYICEIAKSIGRQIETIYLNLIEEKVNFIYFFSFSMELNSLKYLILKHFAYKCLGLVLNKTNNKTIIDKQLDIIFNTVNHRNHQEREVN